MNAKEIEKLVKAIVKASNTPKKTKVKAKSKTITKNVKDKQLKGFEKHMKKNEYQLNTDSIKEVSYHTKRKDGSLSEKVYTGKYMEFTKNDKTYKYVMGSLFSLGIDKVKILE